MPHQTAPGPHLFDSATPAWQPPLADILEIATTAVWPVIRALDVACVRRGCAAQRQVPFLTRLVERPPRRAETWEREQYLALVDRVLLGRVVSVREQDALAGAARELEIDRPTALELHGAYLEVLARAAWADGVVTDAERGDLDVAAELLGLPADAADAALLAAGAAGPLAGSPSADRTLFGLSRGDLVVFTGDMDLPREEWIARAARAGLVAHPNVTKKVALVIAARRGVTSSVCIQTEEVIDFLAAAGSAL